MPVGLDPASLARPAAELRERAARAGMPAPEIAVLTTLPLDDAGRARAAVERYAEAGATRLVHATRYPDASAFERMVDALVRASGG
jgi:hypothetical protein